jgi:hypothetical protein
MNTTYNYDEDENKPAPDVLPAFEVPADLKAQIEAIKRQTSGDKKPEKPKAESQADPQIEAEAERKRLAEAIAAQKAELEAKEREEQEKIEKRLEEEAAKAKLKDPLYEDYSKQEEEDEARLNIKPKSYVYFESREKEPSMFDVAGVRPTRNFTSGRLEYEVQTEDVERFMQNHFVTSGRIVKKA